MYTTDCCCGYYSTTATTRPNGGSDDDYDDDYVLAIKSVTVWKTVASLFLTCGVLSLAD